MPIPTVFLTQQSERHQRDALAGDLARREPQRTDENTFSHNWTGRTNMAGLRDETNVLLTPHIAAGPPQAASNERAEQYTDALNYINGQPLQHVLV